MIFRMFLMVVLSVVLALPRTLYASNKTKVKISVTGYSGKELFFDFIEEQENSTSYPYKEGQIYDVEADLKDITMLKVNSWVWICLQPGDDLEANIVYDGRNYKYATFKGNPDALKINNVILEMRNVRIANRYKNNPRAALVTQIGVDDYYHATLEEWHQEMKILDGVKESINPRVYNYLRSEHEGIFLDNLLSYPYFYGDAYSSKEGIHYPEGFWDVLDNYQLRADNASLRSTSYMGFLLTYKNYIEKRDAHDKGLSYKPAGTMEEEYSRIVDFYTGAQREHALYVFLYNQISSGVQFEEAERLCNDFLKKYCRSKKIKNELRNMLQ